MSTDAAIDLLETSTDDKIEIPDSARAVKPWFPTKPSKEIIAEIHEHIKRTGKPHLWRGHTHTKPPPGSKPVYLDEFDLPEKLRKAARWAPCPCCAPESPKFGSGKIAWFPSEGVIRLLGPECFKKLDAEGHQEAVDNLKAERRREADTKVLLARLPQLAGLLPIGERANRVATALSEFHLTLHDKLKLAKLSLWDHVAQEGELRVYMKTSRLVTRRNGETYVDEVDAETAISRLDGYEVLNPELTIGAGTLRAALKTLAGYIDLARDVSIVDRMSDEARHQVAGEITQAITAIKAAVENLARWQKFATPLAINSPRRWGAHPGCAVPYNYQISAGRLSFGQSEYQSFSVPIPDDLTLAIGAVEI